MANYFHILKEHPFRILEVDFEYLLMIMLFEEESVGVAIFFFTITINYRELHHQLNILEP